jgi:hypothetical protein
MEWSTPTDMILPWKISSSFQAHFFLVDASSFRSGILEQFFPNWKNLNRMITLLTFVFVYMCTLSFRKFMVTYFLFHSCYRMHTIIWMNDIITHNGCTLQKFCSRRRVKFIFFKLKLQIVTLDVIKLLIRYDRASILSRGKMNELIMTYVSVLPVRRLPFCCFLIRG